MKPTLIEDVIRDFFLLSEIECVGWGRVSSEIVAILMVSSKNEIARKTCSLLVHVTRSYLVLYSVIQNFSFKNITMVQKWSSPPSPLNLC